MRGKKIIFYVRGLMFALFIVSAILSSINRASSFTDTVKKSSAYQHFLKGVFSDRIGDFDSAIEEYKKAADFDQDSSNIHFRLALDYIKLDKLEEASKELELAISRNPEVEYHVLLSIIYTSLGKNEKAITTYQDALEQAAQLEPDNLAIYHDLARIYFQQKKTDRAIDLFKQIIQKSPEDPQAHFFLGIIYEQIGKKDLAIQELKESLSFDKDFPDALNSLGYLYAEQNTNIEEAEKLIMRALEIEPRNAAYIDSLGWVYYKQNRIEEAIQKLEEAAGLLKDAVILDHLADAYYKNGLYEKAKDFWQQSLKADPTQEPVKKKLKDLESLDKKDEISRD